MCPLALKITHGPCGTLAPVTSTWTEDELTHARRAVALAAEAVDAGDHAFGSLLIGPDGDVLAEDRNRVVTTDDATAHPEIALARWAAAHLEPDVRAATTMVTSGEHCAMCAAAHAWVGLGPILLVSTSAQLGRWQAEDGAGSSPLAPLSITDVAPGVVVRGPVPELEAEIRALHRRAATAATTGTE